jgi:proteasome activator subunit 4
MTQKIDLPPRRDPGYADSLRSLHSAILGLCALIESLPYSVEPWMPPLTEGRLADFASILTLTFIVTSPCSSFYRSTSDFNNHSEVRIRVQEGISHSLTCESRTDRYCREDTSGTIDRL